MRVRWNLTHRRARFKKSDVCVFSVAKSGRTWFRVLLNKYLSLAHDIPFSLDDLNRREKKIPSILFTHELWEHCSKATLVEKALGKYVVPDKLLFSRQVIVLYRDPRDVLVSLYFHMRKRSENRTEKTLSEFIFDQRHGIHLIVYVMNQWRRRLENHSNCLWVSYEDLKQEALSTFLKVLRFLRLHDIREELAQQAIDFSAFENMKKMEADGAFDVKIIRPGIPSDPESFKVRKGKVGGYVSHFTPEELLRLDQALVKLDPFFNYPTLSRA